MDDATIIRGNRIEGSLGASIYLEDATEALIEGNTITDPREEAGIWVKGGPPAGVTILDPNMSDPETTIQGNTITTTGEVPAIHLTPRVGGSIIDNAIEAAGIGILVERGSTTVISGNTICGGAANIEVEEPTEVDIGDNELCDIG